MPRIQSACTAIITHYSALIQIQGVKSILNALDRVEEIVKNTPAVENSASRFGNPAFRTFYDRVSEVRPIGVRIEIAFRTLEQIAPQLHLDLPSITKDSISEVSVYFVEAWGSRSRIDYGSGMELNFLCWL